MRTKGERSARGAVVAAAGLMTLVACAHRAPRPASARDTNTATASELQAQPTGRVEDLFAGRFPGVQAFASNGGMVVRVRNASTFSSNAQPLFVIDGQAVEVGRDGLIAINPSDVARIEVVKDAAELSMYGSRGGNGVVRITTKRPPRRG